MTTHALTIADFIEARLAEDEADPWRGAGLRGLPMGQAEHAAHMAAERAWEARVLAQCEALRAVVAMADPEFGMGRATLRALARIWSSHPDFDPSWGE